MRVPRAFMSKTKEDADTAPPKCPRRQKGTAASGRSGHRGSFPTSEGIPTALSGPLGPHLILSWASQALEGTGARTEPATELQRESGVQGKKKGREVFGVFVGLCVSKVFPDK